MKKEAQDLTTSSEATERGERKEKIFFKRWFCKHEYKPLNDLRGWFGITQCVKCGEWGQLPQEEMKFTRFL